MGSSPLPITVPQDEADSSSSSSGVQADPDFSTSSSDSRSNGVPNKQSALTSNGFINSMLRFKLSFRIIPIKVMFFVHQRFAKTRRNLKSLRFVT
ncbi:hypothetical protein ElyMa_002741600 [Elysia marginata]|uniref:Uncharacterized protein n=1 Tax=Elysia marginata TaxID=1093978 RepID=A0AAV4HH69_9GAST|nr:hypothetical protein ElyMa_002741600 [Elysia marginata]